MGRYKKEKERASIGWGGAQKGYKFTITDKKTGEAGEGKGHNKREAKENAWASLQAKRTKNEDVEVSSTSSSGGGGGGDFSFGIDSIETAVFIMIVLLITVGLLKEGAIYLIDKVEAPINERWPGYKTRVERELEKPVWIKKNMHPRRIVKIILEDKDKKLFTNRWIKNSGEIVYLNDKEEFIKKEFKNLGSIEVMDKKRRGYTTCLNLEKVREIKIETIPKKITERYPERFGSIEAIPKITLKVLYKNGRQEKHTAFVTSWTDFEEKTFQKGD